VLRLSEERVFCGASHRTQAAAGSVCVVAKFDIRASVIETRSGAFLVMVSTIPRYASIAPSEMEEATARSRPEADELCNQLIIHAGLKLQRRGHDVGEVIGPWS
jgi:hypothetical protein